MLGPVDVVNAVGHFADSRDVNVWKIMREIIRDATLSITDLTPQRHIFVLLENTPILSGFVWVIEVINLMPIVLSWFEIRCDHSFVVAGIGSIKRSEPHTRAGFDNRFSLAMQVESAIFTVTGAELLTSNCEGAILAISNEDAFTRRSNEYFGVCYVVNLNLVAIVH